MDLTGYNGLAAKNIRNKLTHEGDLAILAHFACDGRSIVSEKAKKRLLQLHAEKEATEMEAAEQEPGASEESTTAEQDPRQTSSQDLDQQSEPAEVAPPVAEAAEPTVDAKEPPPPPVGERTCPKCKDKLDIASGFGYRRMPYGAGVRLAVQPWCRSCRNLAAKATRAKHGRGGPRTL